MLFFLMLNFEGTKFLVLYIEFFVINTKRSNTFGRQLIVDQECKTTL